MLNERLGISEHTRRGAAGSTGAGGSAEEGSGSQSCCPSHSYYSYSPAPGWTFLVLDGYDISLLGWPPGHPHHELAAALLDEHNPNEARCCRCRGMTGPCRAAGAAPHCGHGPTYQARAGAVDRSPCGIRSSGASAAPRPPAAAHTRVRAEQE